MDAESLYLGLGRIQARGEIGNAYGGCGTVEEDVDVLADFFDYIIEKYENFLPPWAEAFTQIFSWQFQTLHECAKAYYENFYGDSGYETILRVVDYLQKNGYDELVKPYASAAVDCKRYEYPSDREHLLPDDWIYNNEKTVWNFYVDILEKHSEELTMREVSVMINGKIVKINMVRVFYARNPKTDRYSVNFILSGNQNGVRLFCQDSEEAKTLVKKIREGKITDLTDYPAEVL